MRTRKKASHPVDPAVVKRQRGAFAGDVAQRTTRKSLKGSTAQPRGPPAEAALEIISAKLDAIKAEADAYSVIEFCERHRISVQMFYKNRDEMPTTFRVGSRVLISREAAAAWRAEREAATTTAELRSSASATAYPST